MKKIVILCCIIALSFGAMGATCLQNIQGRVCNPDPTTIAAANVLIDFLKPELNLLLPGSAAFNAYITAETIATGGCVAATALNELIAFVQGINNQAVVATAKGKLKAPAKALPVQPFINWRDGKK